MKKKNNIKSCHDLLSSTLVLLLIPFALDAMHASFFYNIFGPLFFVILVPLKIFLYGGIYAYLLLLLIGEEFVFSRNRFVLLAKKYWRLYLFVSLSPVLILGLLGLVTRGYLSSDFLDVSYGFDFVVLSLMAVFLIKSFLFDDRKFELKLFRLDLNDFFILLLLFCFNLTCQLITQNLYDQHAEILWIFTFLGHYVHFLSFLFFSGCLLNSIDGSKQGSEERPELFLVNPMGGGIVFGISSYFYRLYPAVFVYLNALTPSKYKIREFNRTFLSKRCYQPNKLVAITCYTSNCYAAYEIAKKFKRAGSTVVMGGAHVSCFPDEALEYCDSVVICDLEGVWAELLADYEKGALKKKYIKKATALDYVALHQELLKLPAWMLKSVIETTRGCKFNCYFCTDPFLSRGGIVKKSVGDVVDLLRIVKEKYKQFSFIDNNIFSDPNYARELMLELKKMNLKWIASSSIDIGGNEEMLRLAKESGCKNLLIGYEISSDSKESARGGKFSYAKKYVEYTRNIKKAGIGIRGHFIFGFPDDSIKSLLKLWLFCFRIFPEMTVLGFLIPFPGSRFYQDCLDKGSLTNLNWRKYNMHSLVFKHANMRPKWVNVCFPLIYSFFILTTSGVGIIFLVFIITSIVAILGKVTGTF